MQKKKKQAAESPGGLKGISAPCYPLPPLLTPRSGLGPGRALHLNQVNKFPAGADDAPGITFSEPLIQGRDQSLQ